MLTNDVVSFEQRSPDIFNHASLLSGGQLKEKNWLANEQFLFFNGKPSFIGISFYMEGNIKYLMLSSTE